MKKPKPEDDYDVRRMSAIRQVSLVVTETLMSVGSIPEERARFRMVRACLDLYQVTVVGDLAEFMLHDGDDLSVMLKATVVEANTRKRTATDHFVKTARTNLSHLGWVSNETLQ